MKTRRLGQQGPVVSAIGLGCMGMSDFYTTGSDEAESIATLHRALELGVTLLDTADIYGPHTNEELLGRALGGRYRGQKQKWFALRFDGDDTEIDVRHPGGGRHKPEFSSWRWEKLARLPQLIVPFKRGVYEEVVKAFARHATR